MCKRVVEDRFRVLLACVVAMALGLRLWGLGFGLPHRYHYDEHFYVNTALNLGAGVVHNPPYAAPFLSNLLFPQYAGLFVVQRAMGYVASPSDFEALVRSDPTMVYMLGRLTIVAFGVACVLISYLLSKRIGNERTALVTSALLATTFLAVRDGHFCVPDGAAPTLVMLCVFLSVEAVQKSNAKHLVYAAITAGLAAGMKWTCGLAIIGPLIASWHLSRKSGETTGTLVRRLVLVGLCTAVAFAISSPQIVVRPLPYLNEALAQARAGQLGGFEVWAVDTVSGWLFYAKTAWWGLGVIPSVLAFAGMLGFLWEGMRKKSITHLIVASFPVLYLLAMGSTRHYFARYLLPVVPFLCLFAAWLLVRLLELIPSPRLKRAAIVAAVALTIAQPLANSARFGWLLSQTDTRTLAKEWIEINIPSGAHIAMDWPTHGPPLAAEPTARGEQPVYDLLVVGGTGLADHSASWYRESGYDYLITTSFISEIPLVLPDRDAERRAFYASLDDEFLLIKEFNPGIGGRYPSFIFDEIYGPAVSLWERERPGPVLRVYRVQ